MNRREFLKASSLLALATLASPTRAAAPTTQKKLAVIILRGGMDGLAAMPALGDPDYIRVRKALALQPNITLKLNDMFALHPNLKHLHGMFHQGDAIALHAIAPPYQKRSHFDAQDVLETGLTHPSSASTGWLYRAIYGLDKQKGLAPEKLAYAIGAAVPRILQGQTSVGSWASDSIPNPAESTLERVMKLYNEDAYLGPRLAAGLDADRMMGTTTSKNNSRSAVANAKAAAKLLRATGGPNVAVMDIGGWDSHAQQGTTKGPLANNLKTLDNTLHTFKMELGDTWQDTAIAVVTEFGRTAAPNGTAGTDHGVASAAFVVGGSVNGRQVIANWPGLSKAALHQGRDLQPTLDMRALFSGLLIDHMKLDADYVQTTVFPEFSQKVNGLVG